MARERFAVYSEYNGRAYMLWPDAKKIESVIAMLEREGHSNIQVVSSSQRNDNEVVLSPTRS